MKKNSTCFFIFTSCLFISAANLTARADGALGELSADRIKEIAGYLPDQPTGWGQPIKDRSFWSDPDLVAKASKAAKSADKYLSQELPAWDDNAYLEFSRVGTRPNGQAMESRRSAFLVPLVMAECLQNDGKYLAKINQILDAYATEPTWTLPAHDRNLDCFHRKVYQVDLRSGVFGLDLAEALYLLGDKIDPTVRRHVSGAIKQRVLDPIRVTLATGKLNGWMGSERNNNQNNWNAVCLSGVVGSALTLLPDKNDRALFVAVGEHYSNYYLNSYAPDGYCEEGVGYWAFGLKHFALLREEIVEATGGKIDLFSNPRVVSMALYGVRIRIGQRAIPPFGDCQFGVTPDERLLAYCNDALGLGLRIDPFSKFQSLGQFADIFMKATPCATATRGNVQPEDPLRTFFASVGVLVCRPAPDSSCNLGVGIKAGGNGSHSHNDIGSYEIAVGDDKVTGDPGGPSMYDAQTFGPHRYDFKILNSYGRPLPVIDGKLQIVAAQAHPKVLSHDFTPDKDELKMDYTTAYNVPALKRLVRTMDYTRSGNGEVQIVDEATFSSPTQFDEALVTHGDWKQIDAKTIELTYNKGKLLVTIETPAGFTVKPEKITELASPTFTRLGLVFNKPVSAAMVTMDFKPSS
jgi:hypothetical protein